MVLFNKFYIFCFCLLFSFSVSLQAQENDAFDFDENIEKMKRAKEDVVNVPMNESVENLGKVLTLSKKETSSVLNGLLQTIGQSGYTDTNKINRATLVNACTAVGKTADPDNVDFWQRLGGKVLDLGKTDWNRVAMAS